MSGFATGIHLPFFLVSSPPGNHGSREPFTFSGSEIHFGSCFRGGPEALVWPMRVKKWLMLFLSAIASCAFGLNLQPSE